MIVREIAENQELLDDFDWFNDYKDTRQWAVYAERPDLVKRLDEGHKKWLERRNKRYERDMSV